MIPIKISKPEEKRLHKTIRRFVAFIKTADIRLLEIVPPYLGFGLILFWVGIIKYFKMDILRDWSWVILIIASILTSLTGFIQIYRKEMDLGWRKITGTVPVISGILTVIICCSLGGVILLAALLES